MTQRNFQQLFKTQGQLIEQLTKKNSNIHSLITSKLIDLDKQFYSVFFTIVKCSLKWKQYKADVLVVSAIPILISLNILDGDEIVSVLLLAIYNEYLGVLNQLNEDHSQLNYLPVMKQKYDTTFNETKKKKQYTTLTEITQTNLLDIHQMLLELFSKYIQKMDQYILKQTVRLGYIFCGAAYSNQELKTLEYHGVEEQIYKVQMSDKSMEILLYIICSITLSDDSILHVQHLIDLIRSKAANESRFEVAGLAQSVKTVTENVFEGVF